MLFFLQVNILFCDQLYWEEPQLVVRDKVKFIQAATNGRSVAVVWQEIEPRGSEGGNVYLSLRISEDGNTWQNKLRFAGPFAYKGKEVSIFSLVMQQNGTLIIAVASAEKAVTIYQSQDKGENFTILSTVRSTQTVVDPRIFINGTNRLLLFVSSETIDELSLKSVGIYHALSADGRTWTTFSPLANSGEDLGLHLLPHHTIMSGADYVVFQSRTRTDADYQIMLKKSSDGGNRWQKALKITDFSEEVNNQTYEAASFFNQRPFILASKNRLNLLWERNIIGRNPQIYLLELDSNGQRLGQAERINSGSYSCNYPRAAYYKDQLYVFWYDNRAGNQHIILSMFDGLDWVEKDLSNLTGDSIFCQPVIISTYLYVFWENRSGNVSRLYLLEPDHSVVSPTLIPQNFRDNSRSRLARLSIRWNIPRDSSGIEYFTYKVDQSRYSSAYDGQKLLANVSSINFDVPEDGTWYFHLQAKDNAGNYSKTATVTYIRDNSPPGIVEFNQAETDEGGFLKSNTFSLSWHPPADPDVAGYSYNLQYLSSNLNLTSFSGFNIRQPSSRIQLRTENISFTNIDNGVYALAICAIDEVGNMGEMQTLYFKLNKYKPVTYITKFDYEQDKLGQVNISIYGRGFSEGGLISDIILDRDGNKPYDYALSRANSVFRVRSDRIIDNFIISGLEQGNYKIGLIHPLRGTYFYNRTTLKVEFSGTVKFGDFNYGLKQPVFRVNKPFLFLNANELIIWIILALLGMIFLVAVQRFIVIGREARDLKMEIMSIIEGRDMVDISRKKMKQLKRKGMGIRFKYTLLMTILVVLIVVMVSIPLSFYMIETQGRNLAEGLAARAEVLLGSLTSGAETYLAIGDTLELGEIPAQIEAMPEAQYVIITGAGEVESDSFEHVWAHQDPNINQKLQIDEFVPGQAVLKDEISPLVQKLADDINQKAIEEISDIRREMEILTKEALEISGRTDERSRLRFEELNRVITADRSKINEVLNNLGNYVNSYPVFDPSNPDLSITEYTFYSPAVYMDPDVFDNYFWGLVRIGVSTATIIQEIDDSRNRLILQTIIIAAISIAMGIIGALIMSSITIIPIRKLSRGVERIRDTVDKEKLKDHHIDIKTKDEIRTLADTVNQMTQGLVKAAMANKELIVGKEIQKMFIPLEKDKNGVQGTTGGMEDENIEIFGYYEGAKGVSGDYFDFKKLDATHYAIIKCDVAGKGVPAALIMVEVATIFLTYFRDWTLKNPGLKVNTLVYRINDMIEERGFKGRFAELTVAVLDTKTGNAYLCNAGDLLLSIYDSTQKKMIQKRLHDAPAAGVFPSMLLETKGGYQQVLHKLKKGDTLFLFTDGLHEAKRLFRDSNFKPIKCQEPDLKEGEMHGTTHLKSSGDEELGMERIDRIVSAVFNKDTYSLYKYHNAIVNEELTFDFSNCNATIEESVLALVAVEQVFRLYPDPQAGKEDRMQIDKKIDAFLRKHFLQYKYYFRNPVEEEGDELSNYRTFTHLKEDEQYDDLTLLAIRKK